LASVLRLAAAPAITNYPAQLVHIIATQLIVPMVQAQQLAMANPALLTVALQAALAIQLLQVIALFQAVVMPTALTIRLMLVSHACPQPAKLHGPIKPMALPAVPQLMALGRVALVFQILAIKLA